MNHKNLSFGAVCRHMTVSLGIIDFTAFLRMINNLVIIITILICSKQIQIFCSPSYHDGFSPIFTTFAQYPRLDSLPFPMAGDHLNVAFHLKLRHMNEHYRILSHKPI